MENLFVRELILFNKLLVASENICDNFKIYLNNYEKEFELATIHFLFARNLRILHTSHDLVMSNKYAEALVLLRVSLEGSWGLKFFTREMDEISKWNDIQKAIWKETDQQKRRKLVRAMEEKYSPKAIRKHLAGDKPELLDDLNRVYSILSSSVHLPILQEGDFLLDLGDNIIVNRMPIYNKVYFAVWFDYAALSLAENLKFIDVLYERGKIRKEKENLEQLKSVNERILKLLAMRNEVKSQIQVWREEFIATK